MRPGDQAELLGLVNPGKAHEVLDVVLVGFARARVLNVGEPLELRRDISEALELDGGECTGLVGEAGGYRSSSSSPSGSIGPVG